jgi:DNA-binding NtrC family response regulator
MLSPDNKSKTNILIVDDEKNVIRSFRISLMDEGFQVETSSGGNEAKAKLMNGSRPNVILTDIAMPEGSGDELFRWLMREMPDMARHTVFMSAGGKTRDQEEFIAEMHKKGRVLEKPFSVEDMREKIERALKGFAE